jgi:trans-2,3-dihydro-3-hydroxyanthranilate isomerase
MPIKFSLLDVFADAPFQGTQIPVVELETTIPDDLKLCIASEFKQTETVFIDKSNKTAPFSVYNSSAKTEFGAHTTLAASYMGYELGLAQDEGAFSALVIKEPAYTIESFIDKSENGIGNIQYRRTLSVTVDNYTPEISRIAAALNTDAKHISFSKYKPLLVSVDRPILVVPFTKHEHILKVCLDSSQWSELLADVYASDIFLFAPGSITGTTAFHGRLLSQFTPQNEFPPIGSVLPEFIAYLATQASTTEGTHTFAIDRGSLTTRRSVIHAEFDKRSGKETQCRIGGRVIKMGEGTLLYP